MGMRRYLQYLWFLPMVYIALVPLFGSNFWMQIIASMGIYSILAMSMDFLLGYTGQASLGHAAFYAIGAYTSAILTTKFGLPVLPSFLLAVVAGMVFGAFLAFPAARLKGFYLAMLTLCFLLIIENVLKNVPDLTGGVNGIINIPAASFKTMNVFGLNITPIIFFYFVWIMVLVTSLLIRNLSRSYWGRAFLAVEGGELAASCLGINVAKHKYISFIISAGIASLAGSLSAHLIGFVSPDSFTFDMSAIILAMALVGGLRTTAGPILGALIFTFLPQYLYVFKEGQGLVYGLILLATYTLMPKGLAGIISIRQPLIKKIKTIKNVAVTREDVPASTVQSANRELLKIENISKSFVGNMVLQNISTTITEGSIHALIGPNGSGKSTLVNIITGIYQPDSGSLVLDGERIEGKPSHHVAKMGVARNFQNLRIYPGMTVMENVLLGAHIRFKTGFWRNILNLPFSRKEESELIVWAREVLDLLGLKEVEEREAGNLPYGTQKMVELARAIMAQPKLLLLDEPAAGLTSEEIRHLETVLLKLKNRGITILLIEHHLDFILRMASRVTVLDFGAKIFEGSPAEARQDPRVKEVYIGGDVIIA